MNAKIRLILAEAANHTLAPERQRILDAIANYIIDKKVSEETVHLNFICTHNSRRSIFSQVWAAAAAEYYQISGVHCYSGGTEATAVYPTVLSTLVDNGFVTRPGEKPNEIGIATDEHHTPVKLFSKVYSHPHNPQAHFAAIMTCDTANEACPYIPGADIKFALEYKDPKHADGTNEEALRYHETSLQIAREMGYLFRKVAQELDV